MELFFRTWIAAIGVIVSVGILFVTLVTLEFKRDYQNLLVERMLVIGANAAAPFAAAAELGLPVSDVRNTGALLDIPRQTDPSISGVWILNAGFDVAKGTGPGPSSASARNAIIRASAAQPDGWTTIVDASLMAGVPVRDMTGAAVGHLVIAYPLQISQTRVLAMASELAFRVALIAIFAALVTGVILRLWLAGDIARFRTIMADLAGFEREVWTGEKPDPDRNKTEGLRDALERSRAIYLREIGASGRQKD